MNYLSGLSVFSFLLSACAPVAPSAVETEPGRPPLAPVRLAGGSDAPTVDTWWVHGAARVEQGWTLSAGSGPRQRLELDLLEGAEAHRAPLGVVIEEADGRVWQVSDARA